MAYEASEIMLAAAMMYPTDILLEYSKDVGSLRKLMSDSKQKIISGKDKTIHFGNTSIEKGFTDLMDENNTEALKDLAAGLSAAIGVRKYLAAAGESGGKRLSPSIYMTGNVWPKDVQKFQVNAYGFTDYNSADVIITADKETFYGVSLKKKRDAGGGEPTLINKAFDTLLNGNKFNDVKKALADARRDYFAGLVIQAVEKGIINKKDIKGFDSLKNTDTGKKELFEAKQRNKDLFDRSYIDTKGFFNNINGGYIPSPSSLDRKVMSDSRSMRYFVNKSLAETSNPLWKEFLKVMNEYSDLFAETLLNIILKTKLFDELDSKDLQKYNFNFFLVTGVGNVNANKETVTIGDATILPLKTTLCGLTRIEEMYRNKKYQIVVNESKKDEADAAKIFLQLKRGDLTLLDLEIRYKGSFNPQPQFQGTLNSDFKKLLEKECGF
jgi:hypothetical protein